MLCIKNECMIILSIKIFHTFKKLNLVENEKKITSQACSNLNFSFNLMNRFLRRLCCFVKALFFFSVFDTSCTL